MDVPLALNDIGVQQGFKGYTRKSSTFCHQTGVVGLSAIYKPSILNDQIDMFSLWTLV